MSANSPALWKRILRENFVNIDKLATFLELTSIQREELLSNPTFSLNLPRRIADKMIKGSLADPLFKQFVPHSAESLWDSTFSLDPVNDQGCRKGTKLLHKYQGRVLLICTSACAMHCRYCFRQHFDYNIATKLFFDELKFIAADHTINEVILSGGDPLSLDDSILENLLTNLSEIPHIRKVRFHTRFPIGIPERIDESFLSILKKFSLQLWFVIHVNHPSEFDQDIFKSLKSLLKLGIPILCQSVLLKGINDDLETLVILYNLLVDHGILPYYLHQLDRVHGAKHFEVPEKEGINLIKGLEAHLPGYAIPKYVKEMYGKPAKTKIT